MNAKTIDLTPQRWAQAEKLFDEAADLPEGDRTPFLAKACADDIELRGFILSLLHSDMAEDTFIEQSVRDVLALVSEEDSPHRDAIGSRIGAYQVVSELGSGGMGIVYLAERADEQFNQQVAIKLVRQRLTDPAVEERLVSERQILANLNHPNIARLLDGGTMHDGTPYLVMEYIDGEPIVDYCDRHKLSIDRRLQLFRHICTAVHYAHQNLVVHRDIKASNILVNTDGKPILLDFGIAKLVDSSGVATDGLTRDGMVLLTPENAAPEQVLGQSVTTATDTYALGLLLYRLLSGFSPFKIDAARPHDVARQICDTEPLRPSVRASRLAPADSLPLGGGVSLETVSANRSTTTDKLRRLLSGDLDMIVQMAMRKEPERRYQSAIELAEDIRLHSKSMPIAARTDTWRYRSSKFIRRHFAGVAAGALLIALLATFGIVTTVKNRHIEAEIAKVREVSTFLEEIFKEPDPDRARGLDITAKEILANGAQRISKQLGDRPEIQATLMETIGRVYSNLGEYKPSAEMLEESLRLRSALFGDSNEQVAVTKNELGATLIQQAKYARAEKLLNESLAYNRSYLGSVHPSVADNLHNLAELHYVRGENDIAGEFASRSVEIYGQLGGEYARELAEAKNMFAVVQRAKGNLDEAEKLYYEALSIVESNLGSDHQLIAYYLQNLAVLMQLKGEPEEAKALLHQSIDVTQRVLGDEHSLLGGSLTMLGTLLHEEGDFIEAEVALRRALDIHRNARGDSHPYVGYDLTSLGMLLHDVEKIDEAEQALRDAMAIYSESLGDKHQYVGSALTELGAILNTKSELSEAENILARAIEIRAIDYNEEHPLAAGTYAVYGDTLTRLGRYEEAEEILLRSFAVLREKENRRSRRARAALSRLYEAMGNPARILEINID